MASVGGSASGSQGSRRKSLDAEINLVPFIDLLSMCICFLLMTAVWTQTASFQIKQSAGTNGPVATSETQDWEIVWNSKESLKITITQKGHKVASQTLSARSKDELKSVFAKFVESRKSASAQSTVLMTPHVSVNYGEMMSFLDELKSRGFSNLGLVPVRVR
jgi:biopolymer transport protein TolR